MGKIPYPKKLGKGCVVRMSRYYWLAKKAGNVEDECSVKIHPRCPFLTLDELHAVLARVCSISEGVQY